MGDVGQLLPCPAVPRLLPTNERILHALHGLPPEGLALKRHILDRLLGDAPEWLTAAQVADGGPKRTDASVWYALKALERVGVVVKACPEDGKSDVARFRLAPDTDDVVRAFLADERDEERRSVSPLPGLPRYQRVLRVLYDAPGTSFTVMKLCDMVHRGDVAVRRSMQELYEAGYVTRELPDPNTPGRPQFHYRLNPHATEHASLLLLGMTS